MANHRLLLLLLCGFILFPFKNPGNEITFIDVGQGDGIYLNTGEDVMIDGGSSSSKHIGENTIEPFLMSKGIKSLKKVFITHSDSDHTSGILYLAKSGKISIKELYLPYCAGNHESYDEIRKICRKVHYLKAGDRIELSHGMMTCLSPAEGMVSEVSDVNEHSLVLLYEYGDFSALFTGDAGKESERIMLDSEAGHILSEAAPVTLLKVGHHGSNTSSSDELLNTADPALAVLSYGKSNRYGHPHQETLDSLNNYGIPHRDTAESGAITCLTNGKFAEIKEFFPQ